MVVVTVRMVVNSLRSHHSPLPQRNRVGLVVYAFIGKSGTAVLDFGGFSVG